MKKQSIIRSLMVVAVVAAAAFVVAATRTARPVTGKEECTQQQQNECVDKSSEFLLEKLTRNLLG